MAAALKHGSCWRGNLLLNGGGALASIALIRFKVVNPAFGNTLFSAVVATMQGRSTAAELALGAGQTWAIFLSCGGRRRTKRRGCLYPLLFPQSTAFTQSFEST